MSDLTTDTTTEETTPAPIAAAPTPAPATPAPTLRDAVDAAAAAVTRASETVSKAKAKTAEAEQKASEPDPVAHMLKSLQADLASVQAELKSERTARAKAERERDAKAQEHDALSKRVAEATIVSKLRDMLPPGKSELDIRGSLAVLHEAGKVDRYSADAEAAVKAAHEALKAGNSSLLRADAPLGGPSGAPPQTGRAAGKVRPPF